MLFSQIAQSIVFLIGGAGIFILGLRLLSLGLKSTVGLTLQE